MKRKALFVGIDNYRRGIPALSCARNDANALLEYFTRHGYAEDDVSILRDGTTGEILDELDEQTKRLKPGDFFLFFFAGHGYTIEKSDGSFDRCLAGADDRRDRIMRGKEGISLSEIKDRADKARCPFVVILDACQTKIGSRRAVNTDAKDICSKRDLLAIADVVNRKRRDGESAPFLVVNSCDVGEVAYELEDKEQGLFSFSMLETFQQMEGEAKWPVFDENLINQIANRMEMHCGGYRQHPKIVLPDAKNACGISIFPLAEENEPLKESSPEAVAHLQQSSTKAIPPVSRPPSPPSAEELRRIEELGREMFAKKRAALRRRGELDPYRSDPAGLLLHLQGADRLLERISSASPFATLADTENAARALDGDIEALGRELAWLKENKACRDEVCTLATEVDAFDADLARFKAAELAYAAYTSGMLARTQAKKAFDAGEFLVAKTRYAEAKESLAEAIRKSRGVLAFFELEDADARGLAERRQWKDCIAACDRALAIDPECDEAARLKAKARDELERLAREEAERKAREEAAWRAYQKEESRKAGMTKTITLPGGAVMKMIYCPPGEFMMGSPTSEEGRNDNETQHRVRLTKGFWLGKYPVTQRQWRSVMGWNPAHSKGDDLPVEMVSWNDCQEFIKKVNAALGCGARLPTEAEWEYACRAGTTGAYGGTGNLDEMGWYSDNSGRRTHPVGQKKPNDWGLCDMHGNVYEWCADSWSWGGGLRVKRGGSVYYNAGSCRSACRAKREPDYLDYDYGFRFCCSVGPRGQGAEP